LKFEPWTIAYNFFSTRLEKVYPQFEELHLQLRKGGVLIAYKAYIAFMVMVSIITFIVALPTALLVLPLFGISFFSAANFVFSLSVASCASLLALIIMYVYPRLKSNNRKGPINKNLPYIANFLTLLSSSNVPPSVIFESIANIDTVKEAKYEFSNIIRDVEVFGKDLLNSILENAKLTPDDQLGELLMGYVSTIKTGGNQTEYLRVTSEKISKERMGRLDMMLESLAAMAEIYIMMLVAAPLLFAVLLVTLGMIGSGEIAGMNMGTLLYLLTYAAIPIMGAIMMVIISTFEK